MGQIVVSKFSLHGFRTISVSQDNQKRHFAIFHGPKIVENDNLGASDNIPGRGSIETGQVLTSIFFIFYVFLAINIATSPYFCSYNSLTATFAAMEKTEAVEAR